jgi:hypothetical protein
MTSIEWLRIQLEVRGNTHDIIADQEAQDADLFGKNKI